MKKIISILILLILFVAIFGVNPFGPYRDTTNTIDRAADFQDSISRQANGVVRVQELTEMPDVSAKMVRWWFADYMQTSAHYKKWHPEAHLWMDWENKRDGEIYGASHLVHEYIGLEAQKLRIQFVPPATFYPDYTEKQGEFVLCAKVGFLEQDLNFTTMCHIIQDKTDGTGAVMRSVFWMGHVEARKGDDKAASPANYVGNTFLARHILASDKLAKNLQLHCREEMAILAGFLPELYESAH